MNSGLGDSRACTREATLHIPSANSSPISATRDLGQGHNSWDLQTWARASVVFFFHLLLQIVGWNESLGSFLREWRH